MKKRGFVILVAFVMFMVLIPSMLLPTNAATDISVFNSKLASFRSSRYPHESTYINDPDLTGGYQCFGFANEVALYIFGSYPTNSMSAYTVNSGWTRTYGSSALNDLAPGDIVRYWYHSIFITAVDGDTITYCHANSPSGTNRVTYGNTISRSTLRSRVSETLSHDGATTTGWVAHYNNGVSSGTPCDHSNYTVEETPATCTSSGKIIKTCVNCGYQTTTHLITFGHSYGSWVVTTPAKVGVAGTEKRTCSRCGNYETRSIPALDGISGTCGANGSNLTWTLDTTTGVLKIEGTGAMDNWTSSAYTPWVSYHSSIKTVIFGEGVTSIGNYAFNAFTSITSVDISSTITTIGNNAFYNCNHLISVSMPNVTSIGDNVFYWCGSLKSVSMPKVTSIGYRAFYECDSLASVSMPNIITIGEKAFYRCESLATSVDMPSVKSINNYAFSYCESLESVSMPKVTSIGNSAFSNCDSLASVSMPNVTSIGSYAFSSCSSLASVDMPKVITIGENAFSYCSLLESVEIPASVTSIGDKAFYNSTSSKLKKAIIYSTTATFGSTVFYNTHADFAIYGYAGSTAEAYAIAKGHTFVLIDCLYGHDYELDSSSSSGATCTNAGLKVYVCSTCGETFTETVAALGHNFSSSYTTDKEATCTEAGSKSQHCSGCDATQNVTAIPATGHSYSVTSSAVSATCTASGKTAVEKCSSCGATKGGITIAATGHSYGSWVVTTPAEIGVAGEETRTCSKCGDEETRTIPALEEEIPEGTPIISVSKVSGAAGDSVKVKVALKDNTGFGGLEFSVSFDTSVLELTAVDTTESITAFTTTPLNAANNNGSIAFSMAGLTNIFGSGNIATLSFKVSDDAEEGTLPLNVNIVPGASFYYAGNTMADLALAKENGQITVREYLVGDPDGNGTVNIRDAALILQYIAGWDVTVNEAAADADGNGMVNIRDAALILQYIAGWDVELG